MLLCNALSRLFRILLVCLMILLCAASAEEKLPDITITCRPESIISPAEITLSFAIENHTGSDCENLYISTGDGLTSEPLGSLLNGESASFTRRHSVTEQELEAGKIAYIFSYDDPSEPERKINFIEETEIKRAESHTECEFTRRFSSDTAIVGSTVTILYTVHNIGNVPVEALRVTDDAGDFSGRIETLAVGETRSLVNRVTISQPTVSNAQLTFESVDGTQTIQPESREIGVSEAALSTVLRIASDPADPYTCTGTLIINNTGDVDYSLLTVTDDYTGTVIAEGLTLTAGESRAITYTFGYRDDRLIRWRVIANASNGSKIDLMTDTIRPSANERMELDGISFSAEVLTPKLKRKGNARFLLKIENHGDAEVRDLHITEASLGKVLDFAFIAAGGSIEREVSLAVDGNQAFDFNLTYTDEDSWPNAVAADTVNVTISPDGVMPEDAEDASSDFSGSSIRIGGSYAFAILMIIGVVLLIALTVVWIILSHRARIRKQVRIALQKQNKGRK